MRRRAGLLAAALAATQLAACGQLLFRQSDRLEMLAPANYSKVREPLILRWAARDFSAPADGAFAVFVDRDPMPPGETLDYFAPDDREGIHVLDATQLRIEVLAPLVGVDPAEQNHHAVTVVMLDRSGRRLGEYAGFTEFNVVRGP